jgi:hypothetical protein
MPRISMQAVVSAVQKVRAMDTQEKMSLADEISLKQPNMLSVVLTLRQLGVSLEKMSFAFEILFICFQAMKESGLNWPIITEDEQEKQLERFAAIATFGEDLSASLAHLAMKQYVESHPEQPLFAFVSVEQKDWLERASAEESDKLVVLSIMTLVNCIAFVSLPKATARARRKAQ